MWLEKISSIRDFYFSREVAPHHHNYNRCRVYFRCRKKAAARPPYMLRKFVYAGFHSSPGEGACGIMRGFHKNKTPAGTYIKIPGITGSGRD